jgi:two-component system KDP operon response regulator KdpE
VDDERELCQALRDFLSQHGFEVRYENDGDVGLKALYSWRPDLVITDLSMLRMGGIALCKEIRKSSSVPIIALSAFSDEASRLQAFEVGADDFVSKPFSADELLARIKVTLRRSSGVRTANGGAYSLGPFHVDIEAHKVEIDEVGAVALTPKEFQLFMYMMEHPGKPIRAKELLEALWGKHYSGQVDTVRVLVHQLRKKIEPDPSSPTYLKTEPWVGYRFHLESKSD